MAKTFKEYITESFSKAFSYRIKLAGDYGPSDATFIENILGKYGVQVQYIQKRTHSRRTFRFANTKISQISNRSAVAMLCYNIQLMKDF